MVLTDAEFELLRNRDSALLERLYLHFRDSISTYFNIKTFGNKSVSDDLLHDTFCSIIGSVQRLRTREHRAYWVFTIAKRTLIAYQRKLFRQKKHLEILASAVHAHEDVHEAIHRKQRVLLLKMAIDTLNPEYRAIYEMRYISNQRMSEIAVGTGRSEKAVDDILLRIRNILKKRMRKLAQSFFEDEKQRE
jgi:RNA polymerase sigma factor (sigma-70 family)